MHRDTKPSALPALTAGLFQNDNCLVDNLFASLWRQIGMKTRLSRAGFHKRSGTPVHELVYPISPAVGKTPCLANSARVGHRK
jgi:hypothetical protein